MMEYRVIYYTAESSGALGTADRPWVAYEGSDREKAQDIFTSVRDNLTKYSEIWHVHLQRSERTEWTTVQGLRTDDAEKGNVH